jgi:hypothetical protein
MTVACRRILEVVLALGNGQKLAGRGPNIKALGPLPLVYAANIAATDNRTEAGLCTAGSLDAAALSGPTIVVSGRVWVWVGFNPTTTKLVAAEQRRHVWGWGSGQER